MDTKSGTMPISAVGGSAVVTEVVPGLIYALGGVIPANRPISWYPPSPSFFPVMCYALRDQGDLFLIDTGFPMHRPEIAAGMDILVEGCTDRRAATTRREPDCILNLPWLLHHYKFNAFHFGGEASFTPLDFFAKMEEDVVNAELEALAGMKVSYMRPGTALEIGSLRLEPVRPNLRLLSTYWYYETTTHTLFTSDSWGGLTMRDRYDPWATTPSEDEISVDALINFFGFKFDWLYGADTSSLAEEITKLAERRIDRICPGYGRIIEGREAVSLMLERTSKALIELGSRPPISAMTEWRQLKAASGKGGEK